MKKRNSLTTIVIILMFTCSLFAAQDVEDKRPSSHIMQYGVYGRDGKMWNQTKGMNVKIKECQSLVKSLTTSKKTFTTLKKKGFTINGVHYKVTDGKAGSYVVGKSKSQIVVAHMSKKAIVLTYGAKGATVKSVLRETQTKATNLERKGK